MKNVIIGTAGHVDHGKTMLIKALTGIDTDRLIDEKKHGITIDLGFAHLTLPNGEKVGIIDVPGHEKFIKNMLAGAGGIDIALLIVAADDGVMPQTQEHLGILGLLDIREGIIVITKTDLVDEEWLELVISDVTAAVQGTFLESAPVIAVSARTGLGIDTLKNQIAKQVEKASAKSTARPFRIPIDRVFTMDGFGTVITGSLIEGALSVGTEAEIYPRGLRIRVRNLQVHSKDVQTAFAGQRVAVNLAGIKKTDVRRGDTLAAAGSMRNTRMLDIKLKILGDSRHIVTNGSRLHFAHGAGERLCKLILLEGDELGPGQESYAQLHFTEELAVKKGDRFVVRFYSPADTVGGGVILNADPVRHRRKNKKVLAALRVREQGSPSDNLLQAIADGSPSFTPLSEIQKQLPLEVAAFQSELERLTRDSRILRLTDKIAIDTGYCDVLRGSVKRILGEYHSANPLQAGMGIDELRGRLLPGRDIPLADRILSLLVESGDIVLAGKKVALADFKVQYTGKDQMLRDLIEAQFREARYTPPGFDDIYALSPKDKGSVKRILEAMLSDGLLFSVDPQICFHRDTIADAREKIAAFLANQESITLAQFRDLSGTSRKYALALLEYFDRRGITKKVGDSRILIRK